MKPKYQPVDYYLIADPSYWPLFGSIGIFCCVLGLVNVLHDNTIGIYLCFIGVLLLAFTMAGWFGVVIRESVSGLHSKRMDRTYRWGMLWFIVSEVALFFVFFLPPYFSQAAKPPSKI